MRVKPLTRGMVGQTPPLWRPTGSKKAHRRGLCCGGQLNIGRVQSIEATHGIAWLDAPPKDVQPRPLIDLH